jgi:hypothetical protein
MKHSLPAAWWRCEAAMILADDENSCRENNTGGRRGEQKENIGKEIYFRIA